MKVTGVRYCDFVVWTQRDINIERVSVDEKFLDNVIDKAATLLSSVCFQKSLLSGLQELSWGESQHKRQRRQKTPSVHGAFAARVNEVKCSNRTCLTQWFHVDCIRMAKFSRVNGFAVVVKETEK